MPVNPSQELTLPIKNNMQVFVRQSLTIGATGLVLSLLGTYGTLAQNSSCTNFRVNPKTGIQECLGGRTNSVPSTQNQGQNQAGTVSSDTVNQLYKNQKFDTLPPNQLRPRMPIDSVTAPATAPSNSGTINGNVGAVRGSD
ncbi:MAG TPA: hypothetical protein V6D14_17925 [Coleofasciculaceae cyanobacterium]|jgi:hypothetical protein